MAKALQLLFILPLICVSTTRAQVLPKEGSILNYRIIGFSFQEATIKKNYTLEIAQGAWYNEDSFRKHIIVKVQSDSNRVISKVPSFGKPYTWQVKYLHANISYSKLFHFSTGTCPSVDTSLLRLNILKKAQQFKDAYVFLDGNRVLYDMDGDPVWYLPNIVTQMKDNTQVRDLKLTSRGTITFILSDALVPQIYEINYNGDILWQGPEVGVVSGDSTEHYHHEFTRLANGHYMVMGVESVVSKFSAMQGNQMQNNAGNRLKHDTGISMKMHFGTIIEYDEKGSVVWSWKSSKYFEGSDVYNYRDPILKRPEPDLHDNSFFFDEKNKVIYISYKNISRIIKVKYPEGSVINSYGEIYKQGTPAMGDNLFCYPHSCRLSEDGFIYLFNNNDCKWPQHHPSVIMMKENSVAKDGLEKVWEFECPVGDAKQQIRPGVTLGGSVSELPGKSILVSECSPYGKIFIVNRDKEILWDAMPEKWNPSENKWEEFSQYRISIVPGLKDLEQLIWMSRLNLPG